MKVTYPYNLKKKKDSTSAQYHKNSQIFSRCFLCSFLCCNPVPASTLILHRFTSCAPAHSYTLLEEAPFTCSCTEPVLQVPSTAALGLHQGDFPFPRLGRVAAHAKGHHCDCCLGGEAQQHECETVPRNNSLQTSLCLRQRAIRTGRTRANVPLRKGNKGDCLTIFITFYTCEIVHKAQKNSVQISGRIP